MNEDLEQALYWVNRIKRGEDLHLQDLCISTVQQHTQTLVRHIPAEGERRIHIYRSGLCPNCGFVVELETDT